MKTYQKILTIGAIATSIGLNGCRETEKKYLEGVVKEEFGSIMQIVPSTGALFGNESVKIKPEYGLVIESNGETYTLKVRDFVEKPVLALEKVIEPGDVVKVYLDVNSYYTKIDEDKIGTTVSSYVTLVSKAKK